MTGEKAGATYWLTRFVFLRLLGLVYSVAFLIAFRQIVPLVGEHGLLPAKDFLADVAAAYGTGPSAWLRVPTLFWLDGSDTALRAVSGIGLALSVALLLGLANVPLLTLLWLLYMSLVHVGQLFYGYGWEILLLETGFLAVFLCPLLKPAPFDAGTPPPEVVVWLLRWLAFRLMLGAGLIKLRGDPCWRDLTCLVYHYETQPIPNPLSWYFHQLPAWFHQIEVLFNHLVELVVPWMAFGPRRSRHVAGALLVVFQALLILSGNLSFLNWLTIAVCVSCFDDGPLSRVLPARLAARAARMPADAEPTKARQMTVYAVALVVAFLSLNPVGNMLSPRQVMNTSFEPFHIVNTYGAFGSVGRERYEIVLEGTDAATPDEGAPWLEYEFHCKPGDVTRRPCVVSPYHHRIDWQMWFAAMSDMRDEPWLVRFAYRLLEGDEGALGLIARNPFPRRPPRYVRGLLYRYELTGPGEPTKAWWKRTRVAVYMPPLARAARAVLESRLPAPPGPITRGARSCVSASCAAARTPSPTPSSPRSTPWGEASRPSSYSSAAPSSTSPCRTG